MERYVLDCSVAFKWFVPELLSPEAEGILARHDAGEIDFIAPDSIVAEFGHALRKSVLANTYSLQEALADFQEFLEIGVERIPILEFAPTALRLAITHMATFYDALYVALAEREDLRVLTADERMANAFSGLGRTIRLAEYQPPPPAASEHSDLQSSPQAATALPAESEPTAGATPTSTEPPDEDPSPDQS